MDFLDEHLADLPEVVTAEQLATKLGLKVHAIYQRSWLLKNKSADSDILPPILPVPGGKGLSFPKTGVIKWFRDELNRQQSGQVKPKRTRHPRQSSRMTGDQP